MGERWNRRDLLKDASDGDNLAAAKVVEENIGLVRSCIKRFSYSPYDSEDLFQIGCIGLLKAAKKFDLSYGVCFSTYAVPMIIGEIKRFLRDDGPIKVSRATKELAIKARAVSEMLTAQNGYAPTVGAVASMMGKSSEEIAFALEAIAPLESIYKDENDEGLSVLERIGDETNSENEIVDKIALREIIGSLEARERQIIIYRYFKNKTQSEIADMLKISQVQVSRLEKKILEKMRAIMTV